MTALTAEHFFDLSNFSHRGLFPDNEPVWTALASGLARYLESWSCWEIRSPLPEGVYLLSGPVFIAEDVEIEPGVVIRGPVLLDRGCRVRTGAYLRGPVLCGEGAVVGAHSELKNAILLPQAHAPHQNYVGDSILGRGVNLGAGTILSNVKNVGGEITIPVGEEKVRTGLRKLGAILGDGCKTGCNTVTNPGVLMGPGCVTYPNATLRSGYYPPRTVVKVRQVQQLLRLDR
ncbi:MAG: glucose-1-phosphate thymidylyltransferase [Acidobacteriota bacterium]